MKEHSATSTTITFVPEAKLEHAQETLRLQRVDVLDLQEAMLANQVVPIIHRSEPRIGVPFSALND